MTLIPTGKLKIMEAQTSIPDDAVNLNQGHDLFNRADEMSVDVPEIDSEINPDQQGLEEESLLKPEPKPEQNVQSDRESTIEDYIFQKLESFGWPGRLLQDYKDKFVSRSISAEGVEEVRIELLDKQYPNMSKISTKDIKQIVSDIQSKFGLFFQGGDNNDGKWSFRFISTKETPEEDENPADLDITGYLDKAYGTPSKSSNSPKEPSKKEASTIEEMIKYNKNEIFDSLNNKVAKSHINKVWSKE